jgi:hypothetical protein
LVKHYVVARNRQHFAGFCSMHIWIS